MPHLGMPELLIILALVLVLFGAKKVPEMARGLAQGLREFKCAMREAATADKADAPLNSNAPVDLAAAEQQPVGEAALPANTTRVIR